jgi:hypothetical protein
MKKQLEEMLVLWRKFRQEAEDDGAQEALEVWRSVIEDVEEILGGSA